MKIVKKISLAILSVMLVICSSIIFTGCKDDDVCKLYVFASKGGVVKVNNNKDLVEFGDEGSKMFKYKEGSAVTLKAIPDEGYKFVEWEFADNDNEMFKNLINKSEIKINVSSEDLVLRAVFELDGSISYNIGYPSEMVGYLIVPESGYSTTVALGGTFKFKVNLESDYSESVIVVKANNETLTADAQQVYTISNINSDINITVEGVVKNSQTPKYTVYEFELDFEQDVKDALPDIALTVPNSVLLIVKDDDTKYERYKASSFVLFNGGEQIKMANLIKEVNDFLVDNGSSRTVESFYINDKVLFIVTGDDILVNWDVLGATGTTYSVVIKLSK